MAIKQYLDTLECFLKASYPDCILMPTLNNFKDSDQSKTPYRTHKDIPAAELWKDWAIKGKANCNSGLILIMRQGLIVIDIDDEPLAMSLEAQFPLITQTSIQKTKKGRHYIFQRTPECDKAKLFDKSRCVYDPQDPSKKLEIDIKTRCSNGTGGILSIYPSPGKQWLRPMTEYPPTPIPNDFLQFIIANHIDHKAQAIQTAPKHPKTSTAPTTTTSTAQEEVPALVAMLNPTRFDEYEEWMRIGWCLHNIDPSDAMLGIWVKYSKQSRKFKSGECEAQWASMRDEGLSLGSLHMWAKNDNPYEYKRLINKRVGADIKACNGSHNALAAIASKLLRERFVCATPDGRLWYTFDGNLWKEDKGGIQIRHELSTTVRDQFLQTMNNMVTALSIDDLQSNGSTNTTVRQQKDDAQRIINTAIKLQDATFKNHVMQEMREYFYDSAFLRNLDSKPHLLAFTNGVWDFDLGCFRNASPTDYVSLNTGFPYNPKPDRELTDKAARYFATLHPNPDQRAYVTQTIARQLYGDNGNELFHVHAGYQGSAGNGKTKFFDVLECALGDYARRFPVQVLTAKSREEAGKPMPEYQYWRGRRIIYCTEPNAEDVLNSGIMKDLTGGEKIQYRLLFSNDVLEFRPQYKMHIMCNDPPKVDGADSGVVRRVRKIDYIAKFVDDAEVDEAQHMYKKDETFFNLLKSEPNARMEVLRYFLSAFQKSYQYQMPCVIKDASTVYLEENNTVHKFVTEFVVRDPRGHFTLAEAKALYKACDYYTGKIATMKNDLQKILKTPCHEQVRVLGVRVKHAFLGYSLAGGPIDDGDDGII